MSAQVTTAARSQETAPVELRHDWKQGEVAEIYRTPLTELLFRAQSVHRQSHAPDRVQTCQLISIKTGCLGTVRTARRALTMTRPWSGKACWTHSMSLEWRGRPQSAG
jgi:hypothetical protein